MDPERLRVQILANGTLGVSVDGQSWCMKALHPASNTGPIAGIPDRTGIPVSFVEFKNSFTVSGSAVGNFPWDVQLTFLPSPVLHSTAQITNSTTGALVAWGQYLNTQLTGTTYVDKANFWQSQVGTARLAYYGITISYDCATLTDNGTLTAGQVLNGWIQSLPTAATGVSVPVMVYAGPTLAYDNLINLPLAVQYRAKEGCYMPIKLNNPSLPFINQSMLYFYRNWWPSGGGPPLVGSETINGYKLPQLLDAQLGSVCFRNIINTTMLRVTIRMGVEVTPMAGSSYSSFMHPSPPPDNVALDQYYTISAKLYDGYPDSYNDWNQLWGVIKKVASAAAPVVSSLIPGGSAVVAGAKALGSLIDSKANKKKKNKPVTVTLVKPKTTPGVVSTTASAPAARPYGQRNRTGRGRRRNKSKLPSQQQVTEAMRVLDEAIVKGKT